jgi:hypothetical protein
VDLLKADFTNASLWTKLTPNFTVTGSAAQAVSISTGNLVQVRIPQTADGQSLFGLYRYKGGSTTLDLSSQNYRSSSSWERVAQFDTGQGTVALTANAYVGRVEGLTIDVWSDVDVHAKTKLKVDAYATVSIGSPENIAVEQITTRGQVRLESAKSITDFGSGSYAIGAFGDVVLQAGGSVAGSTSGAVDSTKPFRIALADDADDSRPASPATSTSTRSRRAR